MNEAKQAIDQYNAFLLTADETERKLDMINMGSDYHTYSVSYDAHGHASLICDGRHVH